MCELPWYALAEIFLKKQDSLNETYCLCSRVFLRNKDDNLRRFAFSADLSGSDEELLIADELTNERKTPSQLTKSTIKQDVDIESLSCYCSASHTDNLSTDEHDSLRDVAPYPHPLHPPPLQPSDSGADLTEFVKHDIDSDWQKFWTLNGEKLIWESWIAKYSAYINPEYLQSAQTQAGNERFPREKREVLTLDVTAPVPDLSEVKNRILIRNLSGSDEKISVEVSEGWNPLSPLSGADGETEAEQLLSSSRCGSLRTVDSMTNVTRMTISSLDFSRGSGDSFSSVSSVQSSLSSSTSSEENEDDYQQQWSVLWKKHYEEEFIKQYESFVAAWKEHNITDISLGDRIDKGITNTANAYLSSPSHSSKQTRKNIHKVFQGKVEDDKVKGPIEVDSSVATSLGNLLDNLKLSSGENTRMESTLKCDQDTSDDERIQMAALGLPVAFGSGKPKQSDDSQKESNSSGNLNQDFESCRKRIKAAFNLMGIEYKDTNKLEYSGQVNYKMKHIRLQNRHLKLRNVQVPRHIYFDDDGQPISQLPQENVLLDVSDKQSSADEDVSSHNPATPKLEEQNIEDIPKRKKRKKKILMPPEIRENAHLRKFWHRRFNLFTRFDEGIKLDEESWYSVTPEQIAKHVAKRCACDVIIDGCCGAGGNTIQFAFTCKKVIAIDIDPKKIELARHNAEIYGVADRIEFIIGDFFHLAPALKADVIFFSPPWGGPSYLNEVVYDLESMLQPVPISKFLQVAREITSNIAVFLPKNSNAFLLIDETKPGGGVEIEQNFMNKNLVAITAYYGDLIKKI